MLLVLPLGLLPGNQPPRFTIGRAERSKRRAVGDETVFDITNRFDGFFALLDALRRSGLRTEIKPGDAVIPTKDLEAQNIIAAQSYELQSVWYQGVDGAEVVANSSQLAFVVGRVDGAEVVAHSPQTARSSRSQRDEDRPRITHRQAPARRRPRQVQPAPARVRRARRFGQVRIKRSAVVRRVDPPAPREPLRFVVDGRRRSKS